MDFLAGLAKAAQPKPGSEQSENSSSDLFSSAKLVAEAAQAQINHQPDTVDNAKVAGAAASLLDAAAQYGKLDETQGVGKYLDEAEGYLRKFSTSGEPTEAPAAEVKKPAAAEEVTEAAPVPKKEDPVEEETAPVSKKEDAEEKIPPADAAPESQKPVPEVEEEKPAAAESPEAESEKVAPPTKTSEPDPDEEKAAAVKKIETDVVEDEKPPTATDTEKPHAPAVTGGEEEYGKLAEGLLNEATKGTGAEDYVKAAEGFLSEAGKSEGGGFSGLANLAGGFLKK